MAIEGLGYNYLGCASFVLSPLACIQCCRLWSQPLSRLKPDLFISVFDFLRTFDSSCVPLELFLIASGSCIVHGFQQTMKMKSAILVFLYAARSQAEHIIPGCVVSGLLLLSFHRLQ